MSRSCPPQPNQSRLRIPTPEQETTTSSRSRSTSCRPGTPSSTNIRPAFMLTLRKRIAAKAAAAEEARLAAEKKALDDNKAADADRARATAQLKAAEDARIAAD